MATFITGDEIKISVAFADDAGTPTDPTDATLSYAAAAGGTATTVALAAMTKDSTGNYHTYVDTSAFAAGRWDVQVVSTGAVAAVAVSGFDVEALPIAGS